MRIMHCLDAQIKGLQNHDSEAAAHRESGAMLSTEKSYSVMQSPPLLSSNNLQDILLRPFE